MDFDVFKKQVLSRPDRSAKGDIDKQIRELCDVINEKKDFVTLSSCSGRICLLEVDRKNEAQWLTVTHDLAQAEDFIEALRQYKGEKVIEFREESVILHLACRTLGDATLIIEDAARQCGFGRFGIISVKDKYVVELICMQHLTVPVFNKKQLVCNEYIEYLVNEGNAKLKKSWNAIERLEKFFSTLT